MTGTCIRIGTAIGSRIIVSGVTTSGGWLLWRGLRLALWGLGGRGRGLAGRRVVASLFGRGRGPGGIGICCRIVIPRLILSNISLKETLENDVAYSRWVVHPIRRFSPSFETMDEVLR